MKDEDEILNDNEISTKRRLKKGNMDSTRKKKKGKKLKNLKKNIKIKEDSKKEDLSELGQSYKKRDEPEECISHLESFYNSLKEIDLENIITKKKH